MPNITSYSDALARVRAVFDFYTAAPGSVVDALASSVELEDCTHAAAHSALRGRVPFAALCADLGRVAVETLEHDRIAALTIGRTMARWAARAYHEASGAVVADEQ